MAAANLVSSVSWTMDKSRFDPFSLVRDLGAFSDKTPMICPHSSGVLHQADLDFCVVSLGAGVGQVGARLRKQVKWNGGALHVKFWKSRCIKIGKKECGPLVMPSDAADSVGSHWNGRTQTFSLPSMVNAIVSPPANRCGPA
jgi:hypothetical protein